MSFDVICFDCDSTLSKIEGIDELGRKSGMLAELAALTDSAMNGELALEQVYGKRLEMIRPDMTLLLAVSELYIEQMVPGVEQVFQSILASQKQVHIISGGIRQAILPLAKKLGLDEDHVHAVDIYFDEKGQYQSFDESSPLARSGGKAEVCRQIAEKGESLLMVGDGITDLEAKQAGATVIGFGGVVKRPLVVEKADHFIDQNSLLPVLDYIEC